jgi:gliding motility-associated-like protein
MVTIKTLNSSNTKVTEYIPNTRYYLSILFKNYNKILQNLIANFWHYFQICIMMGQFIFLLISFIISISLYGQCGSGKELLKIEISPDFFSNEISWKVIENNIPIRFGNANNDSVCVDTSQCIIFVINDSGGDGICCNYGNGFYEVFLGADKIANGSSFGSFDSTYYNCSFNQDAMEDYGVNIPTAFSPNNFGKESNNTFSVLVDEAVSDINFFIYDRWGQLIFASNDLFFSWDGTFGGKDCSSGIYAYQCVISYKNKSKKIKTKTGNITLLR